METGTDFFIRQDQAHRATRWLIGYFVLAVLGIIAVLQGVLAYAVGESYWNLQLLAMVSGGVVIVVLAGALYRISELSRGGSVVAEMLGGRQIDPHTSDLKEIQLRNVVEEMAIASGVPVPEIYVLPDESGINAFAAGHHPGDAAVAVTAGALEKFNREELQGVIAHEFSHILNGDMRLNIRLIGVLNGILLLAILGRILFAIGGRVRVGGDRNGNSAGITLGIFGLGVALFIIGWIGVFFAKLIKAAVSRQREFLADASAVQFTRNPDGISRALYKIGVASGRLESPRADEASHMFFGNGLRDPAMSWFATHPPIDARIHAINPQFDPESVPRPINPPPVPTNNQSAPARDRWSPTGGPPNVRQLAMASAMLAALPEAIRSGANQTASAEAIVYSLVLSHDPVLLAKQIGLIDLTPPERALLDEELKRRDEIAENAVLAVIDLCIPTLRRISMDQYQVFRSNIRKIIESDGEVSFLEYVLHKAIVRHLDHYFEKSRSVPISFRSVVPLLPDCVHLFSALAWLGGDDADDRDAAYRAGITALMIKSDAFPMERRDECNLAAVDAALDRIATADAVTKNKILTACGRVILADDLVQPRQEALLRAIADAVGAPVPPFVPIGQPE